MAASQTNPLYPTEINIYENNGDGTGAMHVKVDSVPAPSGTQNVAATSVVPGTDATNLGKAEDAAHTTGDVGVQILGVRNDTNAARSGADGDYTPIRTDSAGNVATKDAGAAWASVLGVAGVAFTSADATTAAAVTDAPTGGQKLVITDIIVSSDTAMFLIFHEESTAGTIIWKVFLPANGSAQFTPRGKIKLPTVDKKLMVDASAAGNISVTALYYSEV